MAGGDQDEQEEEGDQDEQEEEQENTIEESILIHDEPQPIP